MIIICSKENIRKFATPHSACRESESSVFVKPIFIKLVFIMIKVNWTNVAKVLKFLATVITSVLSTMAVQSCMSL